MGLIIINYNNIKESTSSFLVQNNFLGFLKHKKWKKELISGKIRDFMNHSPKSCNQNEERF